MYNAISISFKITFCSKHVVDNGYRDLKQAVIPDSLVDVVLSPQATTNLDTMDTREHMQQSSMFVLLERYENANSTILQMLQGMCTSKRYRKHNLKSKFLNLVYNPWNSSSMDLVGEFHPPSSKGNSYALVNCCLYVDRLYILHSYQEQIGRRQLWQPGEITSHFHFGVCRKLLTWIMVQNFKMICFLRVAEELGVER